MVCWAISGLLLAGGGAGAAACGRACGFDDVEKKSSANNIREEGEEEDEENENNDSWRPLLKRPAQQKLNNGPSRTMKGNGTMEQYVPTKVDKLAHKRMVAQETLGLHTAGWATFCMVCPAVVGGWFSWPVFLLACGTGLFNFGANPRNAHDRESAENLLGIVLLVFNSIMFTNMAQYMWCKGREVSQTRRDKSNPMVWPVLVLIIGWLLLIVDNVTISLRASGFEQFSDEKMPREGIMEMNGHRYRVQTALGKFVWFSTVSGLILMAVSYYWYLTILGDSCFARASAEVKKLQEESHVDLESGLPRRKASPGSAGSPQVGPPAARRKMNIDSEAKRQVDIDNNNRNNLLFGNHGGWNTVECKKKHDDGFDNTSNASTEVSTAPADSSHNLLTYTNSTIVNQGEQYSCSTPPLMGTNNSLHLTSTTSAPNNMDHHGTHIHGPSYSSRNTM